MELKEAQLTVDNWIKENGVRYFNELTNLAVLMEEVGELSRIFARKFGEQSFKEEITEQKLNERLEEEMADIFFVLLCLSNQTGINLESALQKSLEKKTKRDALRHKNNPKLTD